MKFSSAEFSPAARRWCDLLVAEHLALETLRANGIAAVASEIVEGGSRVFLETARFDREGLRGRRPVVTLAAVLAEHARAPGMRTGWSAAVDRLRDARMVSAATRETLRVIETFGRFIANADMHHGNLSFLPRDDGTLALAPVYDMLPMAYAPIGGDVPGPRVRRAGARAGARGRVATRGRARDRVLANGGARRSRVEAVPGDRRRECRGDRADGRAIRGESVRLKPDPLWSERFVWVRL